jgi:hypothetical protein
MISALNIVDPADVAATCACLRQAILAMISVRRKFGNIHFLIHFYETPSQTGIHPSPITPSYPQHRT